MMLDAVILSFIRLNEVAWRNHLKKGAKLHSFNFVVFLLILLYGESVI